MSSMRNAVQRRNHKERSQPEERKKLGLLEKHKDYSARAKDFNQKKKQLANLRKKVLEKNPDEFYHGMLSRQGGNITVRNQGKSTGTVDGKRESQVLSQAAVRLFKTQDAGYIRTMRNQTRKEVEVLEMRLKGFRGVGAGGKKVEGQGRKTIFCEDEDDLRGRTDGLDRIQADDDDDVLDWSDEESEKEEKEDPSLTAEERAIRNLQRKEQRRVENKLELARERLKALTQAEEALEMQRLKMSKTPGTGGITKSGAKFKIRTRKS